ncbi:helix-turn-helix domain-containing protein [Kutzneria viridogrisea]|uniref:HTH hxlR-type domain-containing protein n=2 Tax=Kutzneria TaxID=43356 RepID=W5W436_9PSEU|nr:hypothetical protein KALB_2238 [Kutzneria albida DSM 43870]
MDLLGDWWTPLVLREAFYGVRRFDDFQQSLGVARNTLTTRLNRLVEEGLLERVPYQDRPVRHEYLLTDKGRDFFPVLAAMVRWGDRWLAEEAGPPVVLRHECGHTGHPEVVCTHCGGQYTAETVRSELGPGFPQRLRSRAEVQARFGGDTRS